MRKQYLVAGAIIHPIIMELQDDGTYKIGLFDLESIDVYRQPDYVRMKFFMPQLEQTACIFEFVVREDFCIDLIKDQRHIVGVFVLISDNDQKGDWWRSNRFAVRLEKLPNGRQHLGFLAKFSDRGEII